MPVVPVRRPLPMTWVDAFTDRAFGGNPCVVVFHADQVDEPTRIGFTRETRLSECAFLQDSAVADVGVRYYTAGGEIPMAGHPTIATVTALLDRDMVALVHGRADFSLEVGAGVLQIEVDATGDGPPVVAMRQLRPTFGRTWDPAEIAPLVGLAPDDFRSAPQTVSTGTPFLVCPLVSHEALRRAVLDVPALLTFHEAHDTDFFEPFLTAMGGATAAGDVYSRLLLTPPEPPEDPFTGSATGCLGAWLWAHGELDGPTFVAEQGHDMDRPGQAEVTVLGPPDDIAGVRVAGRGVVVMRGEAVLPVGGPVAGSGSGGSGSGDDRPGVTVVEPAGVPVVRAAASGVTAYIGETEKHLDAPLARVTSFADFDHAFGSGGRGRPVATAVRQFFANGGTVAVVAPARPEAAAHAAARAAVARDEADLLVLPPTRDGDLPTALVEDAVAWAEANGVMVLLDPPASWASAADAVAADRPASPDATLWLPRGRDDDGTSVTLTGAIAGVLARTDRERGVWKAPAGLEARVRGVTPSPALDDEELGMLAQAGINGLRTVAGTTVVWGARTLSSDPEWRYVPVRRTALWLERSITRSLDGRVPAAVDDAVLAATAGSVTAFMHDLYRAGALEGARVDEAFFVRCDRSTTTAADVAAGVVRVAVGFAPLRPAEFVVLDLELTTRTGS
jgi:trans-2,3-dihydro-3-hydroxyanthranilate isomerase